MTCLVHPDTQVRLPPEYMVLCGSYPESGTTGLLRVSCNPSHHGVVIAGLIANAQVKTACLGCVVRLFDAVESNEEADTIRRSLVTVTDDGNTRPTSMLSAFVAFLAQTTPMPVSYPPLTRFFFSCVAFCLPYYTTVALSPAFNCMLAGIRQVTRFIRGVWVSSSRPGKRFQFRRGEGGVVPVLLFPEPRGKKIISLLDPAKDVLTETGAKK